MNYSLLSKGLFFIFLLGLVPVSLQAQDADSNYSGAGYPTIRRDSVPQKDLIDVFKTFFMPGYSTRPAQISNDKIYFSFLPAASGSMGPGQAFVTSTTAGFYLGDPDNTKLSSISFTPYFNFRGRYGLPFRSNIWFANNKWLLTGDTRLMVYPQDTWGLGGNQPSSNRTRIDYKYLRFYQGFLRRIKPYFFAGVGYAMDYHFGVSADLENTGLPKSQFNKLDAALDDRSFSSGPNLNLLYDTRNNSINPMPGCYANLIYRMSSTVFGGNNLWQSVYLDMRKYVALSHNTAQKQNTLAFWTYYWTTLNKGTPYLSLPSIGWDVFNRSGRGIEQNRYRGQGLIYAEAEYRRGITNNGLLGFVVFANATSVTEPDTRQFSYIHPAGGAGLRIKFNKKSNTNIALDYGFSSGYRTFRLALGEAF
ncbi:BamA/TamA family outer membrane protein [Mucilaginibacter robiniae]|uniref:BamA/TamA family outer membrane protein n=1 Tax=Mucilaginibacter robiniae TaxID=2728022 RepID=A0A7L5E8Y5_9SPHI|nr:BamA/TamA family outer membrane protein [Mucilaginibacter robiniae]